MRTRVGSTSVVEQIAVVGMACRAPGQVLNSEDYWALLAQGRDAIGPVPKRWETGATVREGGFLLNPEGFDAAFFGISPGEARAMDPAQRLVLEVGWEALERSRIAPRSLTGSSTAVVLGAQGSARVGESLESTELRGYQYTGQANSVLSGRLSYLLDLRGPALTVDTASSSSLVALHLACNALRLGECDLALAGGVEVTSSTYLEFAQIGALAPDGRCKAFSEQADGIGWAEGVGIVVLKRLSDAQRDVDQIWATIPGSAVNQDGRSQGLTAPNGPSQQRVIEQALLVSGLGPEDIDAVEAHGTGTSLGDPVEAGALAAVFGPTRGERPLWLGSSKSNIGHAQAAAGILGVLKMAMALAHEELPKTLHAEQPSSHIVWQESGLALLQTPQPWPRSPDRVRRAGVSSFGISGTNAHLILEEAPSRPVEKRTLEAPRALPILLSGQSEEALLANAQRLREHLEHHQVPLIDLSYSLATTRTAFDYRTSVTVTQEDAIAGYPQLVGCLLERGFEVTRIPERVPCVLLFPGQGSQYQGMGLGLLGEPGFEVFSAAFAEVERACRPYLSRSLRELVGSELVHQTDFTQPALFALGVALHKQWEAWGVTHELLLGHSSGELVAAYLAGVWSLEDAAKLICARGRLMEDLATPGGVMVSVEASAEEVAQAIKSLSAALQNGVEISSINSDSQVVISGDEEALKAVQELLEQGHKRTRQLKVSLAGHSAHIEPVLEAFRVVAQEVEYRTPTRGVISNLTGQLADLDDGDLVTADYWVRQLREPVRFADCLESAGVMDFLECGPGGGLIALAGRGVASLRRQQDDVASMMTAVAGLHERGQSLTWQAVFLSFQPTAVALPTYAFQHQRFLQAQAAPQSESQLPEPDFLTTLGGLSDSQRYNAVLGLVRQVAAKVLGLRSVDDVPADRPLEELGLDSLTAVELRNRLVRLLGRSLPIALALEYSSLEMTSFLLETHFSTSQDTVGSSGETFPLSYNQIGLWLIWKLDPSSDVYHHSYGVRVRGVLSYEAMSAGLRVLVERHAALRTTFPLTEDGPSCRLVPGERVKIERVEASSWTAEAIELRRRSSQQEPFDLESTPPVRVLWMVVGREEHILSLVAHHVVLDGHSIALLGQELMGLLGSAHHSLGEPPEKSFRDFTFWQRNHLATGFAAEMRGYWQQKLGGRIPVLELPTDLRRSEGTSGVEVVDVRLDGEVERRLRLLATEEGATLNLVLLALYFTFLFRVTGQADVIVGSPTAHRTKLEFESVVGCFMNMLPLRATLPEGATFRDLLVQLRTTTVEALTYQEYPFPLLVNELRLQRFANRSPVFQTAFLLHKRVSLEVCPFLNGEGKRFQVGSLEFENLQPVIPDGNYEVVLVVIEEFTSLSTQLRFDAGLFSESRARELGEAFKGIVEQVLGSPGRPLHKLELVRYAEQAENKPAEVSNPSGPARGGVPSAAIQVVADIWQEVTGLGPVGFDEDLFSAGGHSLQAATMLARLQETFGLRVPLRALFGGFTLQGLVDGLMSVCEGGFEELEGRASAIRSGKKPEGTRLVIERRAAGTDTPLSPDQRSIWSLHNLDPERPAYNTCLELTLGGSVDVEAVERALNEVCVRHEILRSIFPEVGRVPVQRVLESFTVPFVQIDGRGLDLDQVLAKEGSYCFDLSSEPLFRGALVEREGDFSLLVISHQMVMDYTSMSLLVEDFGLFYEGELPPSLPIQYGDYVTWEGQERRVEDWEYWRGQFQTPLAPSLGRRAGRRFEGPRGAVAERFSLPEALTGELRRLSKDAGVTLFTTLLSVFSSLLTVVSGEDSPLVFSPLDTRDHPELKSLIGLFTKHLPLRLSLSRELPFIGLQRQAKERLSEAVDHRDITFEELEKMIRETSPGTGTPFVNRFVFVEQPLTESRSKELSIRPTFVASPFALFELSLIVAVSDQEIQATFVGQQGLHSRSYLEQLRVQFLKLVERVLKDPHKPLRELLLGLDFGSDSSQSYEYLDMVVAEIGDMLPGLQGPVPVHRPIFELGFHSLMAVELRLRLMEQLDRDLVTTFALDYPTAADMAKYLGQGREAQPVRPGRRTGYEGIAIISMACRAPGGVDSADGLWEVLERGEDRIETFPSRWGDISAFYDPEPGVAGKTYAREGGFLEGVEEFDTSFFEISPREALAMEPQQRLTCETSWEALEEAGIVPSDLEESHTGVYLGSEGSDYALLGDFEDSQGYRGTGQASSVLSGRVSYFLNLRGPAITVDTACSSSLVAVHLACAGLRDGECDLALAGGARVMCTPGMFIEFSSLRGLARDGRCKAFSEEADGTGWSEGVGVLVLKRLSDAQADGDPVLAVIRGSATNHDGRSQGLTAPNGLSQERVIQEALTRSGLRPEDIDVIEAHGTGTQLGDPIEANALGQVFGGSYRASPLWLGSLKSNIGHTQAAAGVLGVMKMVLALNKKLLPRTLHAKSPSSQVNWEASGLELLQEAQAWPRCEERIRRAGVSSFGVSGTNAHLVLEEAPEVILERESVVVDVLPLLVSGKTVGALRGNISRLLEHLEMVEEKPSLADLGYTLAVSRTAFEERAMFVATAGDAEVGYSELCQRLREYQHFPGTCKVDKLAVMFSGQGSQRRGMGLELLGQPGLEVFTRNFQAGLRLCDAHLSESLLEVLQSEALGDTRYTQPALFVLETALYRQWEAWGVKPELLIGHSVGELVAAHVSGVFNLEDGCRLVCARGQLMAELATRGGVMASLRTSEEEVLAAISELGSEAEVAGVNTSSQTVVSGSEEAVTQLIEYFQNMGKSGRLLDVSHAFHSTHMEGMLESYKAVASELNYKRPQTRIVSTVTGQSVESLDAEYWLQQVRRTVRFAEAVGCAQDLGVGTFLECGPGGALSLLVDGISSLGSDQELAHLMGAAGALHLHHIPIDWEGFYESLHPQRVDLPTYAFQGQYYWLKAATQTRHGSTTFEHPVLRTATELPDGNWLFTGCLDIDSHEWLRHHIVHDTILAPGTSLLELCLCVGETVDCSRVESLLILQPMAFDEQVRARELQLYLSPQESGFNIRLRSRPHDDPTKSWILHVTGGLTWEDSSPAPAFGQWPPRDAKSVPFERESFYERLASTGLDYGPMFRGMQAAWNAKEILYLEVSLPEGTSEGGFWIHPALMDAVMHGCFLWSGESQGLQLPFKIEGACLFKQATRTLRVRLSRESADEQSTSVKVNLWDGNGEPVAEIERQTSRSATASQVCSALGVNVRRHLHELRAVSVSPTKVGSDRRFEWADLDSQELSASDVALDLRGHGLEVQELCTRLLGLLQGWLKNETLQRLSVVTRESQGESVTDVAGSAAWGLLRCLRSERPELRVRLFDTDTRPESDLLLERELGAHYEKEVDSEFLLREGQLLALELGPLKESLELPDGHYRLKKSYDGSLAGLAFQAAPELERELGPGEVRVQVRAVGLNFRDVLNALNVYPQAGPLGSEVAGVVSEVGTSVESLKVGDRVMGLVADGFSKVAIGDSRLLIGMPSGLSFAQAATIPMAFLTAYYALKDLAQIESGERLLIHAVSGGVGMAALQLGRYFGCEIFGTASRWKWDRVELDSTRLSNSRDLSFESEILERTDGQGVDVVLNALKGDYIDASLRLLSSGGRFLEMGKRDIRAVEDVTARHPGVAYLAFDLLDAGPKRIQDILRELVGLFGLGALEPLPLIVRDFRQADEVFRTMAQAKHVGKLVLTPPPPSFKDSADGTVLVTGATGGLGRALCHHLVTNHGVDSLVLLSRSGERAEGAQEFLRSLREEGAQVVLRSCDVSREEELEEALELIPPGRLKAIFHLAAVLQDGVFSGQSKKDLETVLRAKLGSALNLDILSRTRTELSHFVMFSSTSGVLGSPGQANYAAANAGLDALAKSRRAQGYPAQSIAWGPWSGVGMASKLSVIEERRLAEALSYHSPAAGIGMLDEALEKGPAVVIAARFAGSTRPTKGAPGKLPQKPYEPDGVKEEDRYSWLLSLVRGEVAQVLGLPGAESVPLSRSFHELGLDSLMAVELRNRLMSRAGFSLPIAFVFDYPKPEKAAEYLLGILWPDQDGGWSEQQFRDKLSKLPLEYFRRKGLVSEIMAEPEVDDDSSGEAAARRAQLEGLEKDALVDALRASLGKSVE